jgi:hypothetical protein
MRPVPGLARVRRLLLLVGVAFAALPVGSALADTTIGQVGGDPDASCPGPVVLADTNYVVPAGGGVITSFSFQSTGSGQQVDFLVLRPTGGGSYTVVGETGPVTLGTGLQTSRPRRPFLSRAATSSDSGTKTPPAAIAL